MHYKVAHFLAKNEIWYMHGSLNLENWYLYGWLVKFAGGTSTSVPKPNLNPPPGDEYQYTKIVKI